MRAKFAHKSRANFISPSAAENFHLHGEVEILLIYTRRVESANW